MPASWRCKSQIVVGQMGARCMCSREIDPGGYSRLSKQKRQVLLRTMRTARLQLWGENLGKKRHPDLRHRKLRTALLVTSQLATREFGKKVRELSVRPGLELALLCEEGQLEKALGTLHRMDEVRNVPSVDMYKCLLRACSRKRSLAQAKQVHAHLAKHGLECTESLGEFVGTLWLEKVRKL